MKYSKNCPFCMETRFENNKMVNLLSEETILYRSENIYVQVDISPLCVGHILIIPNYHYLNCYQMPKTIKDEIVQIKKHIINS